ncbi:flagellin [Nitrobacter sp. TKz-YC02]|uniref:flagellin N-terminal helical domain-containing protein n=1 Tax=Nitrobacter sp. TKz-YC02 TaxID=3398704 RepID=UPI003CED1DAE
MSDIVLSASVRQNLLSLQSTADLLAQTQNRLSTGKKVNTALDNPTNYFTAAALDNRANDISNLLDGIGNGIQVLQAANTGLTSLQKLVDTAKSVANQVLQSQVGYSQKSSVESLPVTGATALDLRGTTPFTNVAATPGTALKTGTANAAATGATLISALTDGAVATPTGPAAGESFSVNGKTITFAASGVATTDPSGNVTIGIDQTLSALTGVIDTLNGNTTPATASTVNGSGQIALNTGIAHDLTLTDSTPAGVLAKLGLTAGTTARGGGAGNLDGKTLTIGATGGGVATNITFGDGTNGTVRTLNDLNAQLASNNLQATINSAGVITISTANEAAAETIGAIGGTAAGAGYAFNGLVAGAPVQDSAVQAARAGLVSQYNNIIQQINTTAADSSFNGINLLSGDTLKLIFNETAKSTLTITGTNMNAAGLGLSALTVGIDFLDNGSANSVIASLDRASTTLRTQASTLGSNLSIVQIRQDFSKNLINVLQTGSSNLTLADTNEEAANSQALATRQSIAVSALALANQSQQSVLQLLR